MFLISHNYCTHTLDAQRYQLSYETFTFFADKFVLFLNISVAHMRFCDIDIHVQYKVDKMDQTLSDIWW